MELLWNIKSRVNFDNKYEKYVEIYGAAGTISIGLTTKETLDEVFKVTEKGNFNQKECWFWVFGQDEWIQYTSSLSYSTESLSRLIQVGSINFVS